MSTLPILQLERDKFTGSPTLLRAACVPVTDFGPEFQLQLSNLIETFKTHKIAVGLAAPQVGIQRCFSVINVTKGKSGPNLVIVNPKIIASSRQVERKHESCMSLPHFRGEVERPKKVTVAYLDEIGKERTIASEGFLARVLCHEIDHLNGILYVDRMGDISTLEPVEFFKDD